MSLFHLSSIAYQVVCCVLLHSQPSSSLALWYYIMMWYYHITLSLIIKSYCHIISWCDIITSHYNLLLIHIVISYHIMMWYYRIRLSNHFSLQIQFPLMKFNRISSSLVSFPFDIHLFSLFFPHLFYPLLMLQCKIRFYFIFYHIIPSAVWTWSICPTCHLLLSRSDRSYCIGLLFSFYYINSKFNFDRVCCSDRVQCRCPPPWDLYC